MSWDSFEGQLQVLCCSLSPSDAAVTLDTISTITQNAVDHPEEEKYRRLRTANKTFSQRVWCHQAARDFMKMIGWTEVDDTVVLLSDDFLQMALVELAKCKSMLEEQLTQTVPNGLARGSDYPTTVGSNSREYQERIKKMRELQERVNSDKKRIAEQIKADRQETIKKDSLPSRARQLKFGANLNRFEDIGVDLNAGVLYTLYLLRGCGRGCTLTSLVSRVYSGRKRISNAPLFHVEYV